MNARTKVFITFFVLIVLLGGMYFFTEWFSRTLGYLTGEEQKVRLVQCLDEKDAVFYFSGTCPDCDRQKEILGDAVKYLRNAIDCGESVYICRDLKGIPAWQINGEFYYGFKSVDELGKISGCDAEIG